jgi:hypothetical protein
VGPHPMRVVKHSRETAASSVEIFMETAFLFFAGVNCLDGQLSLTEAADRDSRAINSRQVLTRSR